MNKNELVAAMAKESGLTQVDSKKALEAAMKSITTALAEGDRVSLIGFGTFSVNERAARTGVNPATQKPITIPAKKVAKFKPGAELADAIAE